MTVELKNDLSITGVLHSVDQYLNVKLNSVKVVNESKYPHMVSAAAHLNRCCPSMLALTAGLSASVDSTVVNTS